MRAVTYDSYATDNSRLRVQEVDHPKVGPGQLLIEVKAAGVNPVDWKLMAGGLDSVLDVFLPVIPGWDVAGVVRESGLDSPEFAVGDEVMAYARKDVVRDGTYAQYVTVNADAVARRPATLSWAQAGGLPLAGLTARRSLETLGVGPGDVLLVHAASGGVGGFAVQLAVHAGARVIGTASPANHDFVRSLGAEPVAYGEGLVDRVRELAPEGLSAVADFAGGQLEVTQAVLAAKGRHVSTVDTTVEQHGGRWVWVRPDGAGLTELADLAEQGALTVEVARTYPLEEAGAALDASRAGHTRGKLVLVP